MYEIKKGIPIPGNPTGHSGRRIYPFQELDVGDMFFIPNRQKNNFAPHTWKYGKRHNVSFTTRLCYMKETLEGWAPCEETEKGAVRGIGVWRVK